MKINFNFKKSAWFICFFLGFCVLAKAQESELLDKIKEFPEVKSIQKVNHYPFFKETYEILIDQYLNHENPSDGKFTQRVILSDLNKYSPVIYVTEGYNADYALKPNYINELSKILEGNQIVVEHRYFGKSMPNNPKWEYLTVKNACADLHRIQKIFSRIYDNKNKWIVTGSSKGGTNALAYKTFYPDDADIWIAYVPAINYDKEDKRLEKFLDNVGSAACRDKIDNFQKDFLKNRDAMQVLLDSVIDARNLTFKISKEEVLDYWVLEYEYYFWQYGSKCNEIPLSSDDINKKFKYLLNILNPDYFSNEGSLPYRSYYIQAAKELGHYGYNVKPLKEYLKIKDAEGFMNKIFIPDNTFLKYDKSIIKQIEKSILNNGKHVLLIYGEFDPWAATAIKLKPNSEARKITVPGANHNIKIGAMPYKQKADIYMMLETWLNED
ncbi:MAG: hypothetical protein KA807_11725 [Prolixibacteraceae bacterium]|nr:hypothetical protein [Prolixibacteraceae bacterium]